MNTRCIVVVITFLMLLSGFTVLIPSTHAPSGYQSAITNSNDTVLYEFQLNNTGSSFTDKYFPFTFTNESLFDFNTTDHVVQNVKFLYSNGTQIKGFIPTGQSGLPNTDQGSGKWLVYLSNFSMTAGQKEDIYMQVFPATESVLNANFSTSTDVNIGLVNLNDFSDTSLWKVVSNNGATVSSTEITVSDNQAINITYVGSALPDNINLGYTLGYHSASDYPLYMFLNGATYLGANVSGIYYGDGVDGVTSIGTTPYYYHRNLTGSAYGDEIYTLTTGSIQYQSFSYTYAGGDLNWTDWTGKQSVSVSSLKLGFIGSVQDITTSSVDLYLTAITYWDASQSGITQKNIGTVTSISPTSTGNYILFNETGLPYGQSWNVSLTNKTANVVNSVYASTTNTVKAFLPTGYNYSFVFSTFDKSYYKIVNLTGNIYLNSKANATVNITLINVSYDVIFHESGIVSGNAWGINFNGTDHNTTSTSLTIIEKNGSYPFTVLISNLYDSNVSSGYANVSGQSLNFYIGFTYHAFNITFSEVGLPSGVKWSMTINGTVYYSNLSRSNTLLFQGKAGSYDGIVNNASYYTPMDKYFNFTITGNAQYTIDYGIILTFIETGYKGLWHITINGVSYSSSTNTIVVTVSPGQVIYNVWGVPGYTISPELVTQTYTSAQTIKITFAVQPASFENVLISTPMIILYFVLAVMTMVGVVYWRLKHEK